MQCNVVVGEIGQRNEPLVLGVTEGSKLPTWANQWPDSIRREVAEAIRSGRFQGKLNETFLLKVPITPRKGQTDGSPARWVVLVGVGKADELTLDKVRQAAGSAARRLVEAGFDALVRGLVAVPGASVEEVAQAVTEGTILGTYRYLEWKSSLTEQDRRSLNQVTMVVPSKRELEPARVGVRRGVAIAEAVCWVRDLINRPSNQLTPSALADEAKQAARRFGFRCRVLGPEEQRRLGMNALLGVACGSRAPSQFIVVEYVGPGSRNKRPLAWLGKGITFDSGGISLKPAERMEQMKYDMAGGAAVLGAIRALAALKWPVRVVGLVPATENLPGGNAQKPGDVVKTLSGKTVEVINTDAEGRLVLADALGYAQRYKPLAMVDLATLTGACVVALGPHCMGLMGNDAQWIETVKSAAQRAGERAWELPLWPEYSEAIRSDVADLKNIGEGGKAGAIVGGAFLKEFAGTTPWVHLDIAGMAWADGDKGYLRKGATGVGVRLLVELARHMERGKGKAHA